MANVKISELTAKIAPDGGEELVFAEGGSNGKVTLNTVKNFVQPTIDSAMSNESENAVQNKVVKSYVDGKTVTKSSTAPEEPTAGDQWYNTSDNKLYLYDGENWNEVGAGSGSSFDPEGYYNKLHAGLADNLYTNDNIIDVDTWNFRTTAGSQSVPSSGIASLNYIRGKSVRTVARTECVINFNTSDGIYVTNVNKYQTLYATNNATDTYTFTLTSGVWDTDPSTYGLTVQLQQQEFAIENGTFSDSTGDVFKAYVTTSRGSFRMLYDTDNSVWTLSNGTDTWTNADTTTFGITTPGSTTDVVYVNYYDECTDGTIELIFTAEVRGEISNVMPTELMATGVNQYDGTSIIDNVEIQDGEIVAGNNHIIYVPAYGGVTNGYMAYCPGGFIVNCGRVSDLNTTIQVGTAVDSEGAVVDSIECSMPYDETGYFLVEVSQSLTDADISVHPRRSGQQNTNTDEYETSVVTIPTYSTDYYVLPTDDVGMPNLGGVYDELNGQLQTYTKRIEIVSFDYGDLLDISEMGVEFDYDEDFIYYVLGNPVTYQVEFDNTYTANDYGTERINEGMGSPISAIATEISTSYGSNLVDKLRTGVVTKEEYPQVIDQDTYDDLPASKNTDGIIRFIFTEEA